MMNINSISFNIKYERFNSFITRLAEEITINNDIKKPDNSYYYSESFLKIYFINIFHTLFCDSKQSEKSKITVFHTRVLGLAEFQIKDEPDFFPAIIAYTCDVLNDGILADFIQLFYAYTDDLNKYLKSTLTNQDIYFLYSQKSKLFQSYLKHNTELIGEDFKFCMFYIQMFNLTMIELNVILELYPDLIKIEHSNEYIKFWQIIFQKQSKILTENFVMKYLDYFLNGNKEILQALRTTSIFFDLPIKTQKDIKNLLK